MSSFNLNYPLNIKHQTTNLNFKQATSSSIHFREMLGKKTSEKFRLLMKYTFEGLQTRNENTIHVYQAVLSAVNPSYDCRTIKVDDIESFQKHEARKIAQNKKSRHLHLKKKNLSLTKCILTVMTSLSQQRVIMPISSTASAQSAIRSHR